MKICIIGAGSTYSPELIEGILLRKDVLPLKELYLMDIDERKLRIVGSLCKRMVDASGMGAKVVLTEDLDEALTGADFVLVQIRVGKLAARILDEKIPLKYDLIGQETCGIGGFFKSMRTIPVMIDIVKRMEVLCPNAWMINFSNPSGIIAQALLTKTNVKMMGLCNVPINMIDGVKKRLGLPNAQVEYLGLNHLTYITAIRDGGVDYLGKAINEGINSEAMKNIPASGFSADLIKTIGAIPSSYLEYYYYKEEKLAKAKTVEKCRGEVCVDIEEDLLKLYENTELREKPALLSKRGGARYSEAAISLVDAIWNDKQEIHVVNILNQGALPFMENDDAVEISAVVGKNGAKPVKIEHFDNPHIIEYIKMIKAFERHTVEAAVLGSDEEAMRAFLINPLIGDYKKAKPCYEEMKSAHQAYLPQFVKK